MTQRRVENTRVHFWMFSPVSVKYILNERYIFFKFTQFNLGSFGHLHFEVIALGVLSGKVKGFPELQVILQDRMLFQS